MIPHGVDDGERMREWRNGGITQTKKYTNIRGETCTSAALSLTCLDSSVVNEPSFKIMLCFLSFKTVFIRIF
jgi:hypothetical protein